MPQFHDSRERIQFIDKETGAILYGGQVLIISENDEDYTCAFDAQNGVFNSFWAEENPNDPNEPLLYRVPFGTYYVVTTEAPHFPDRKNTHKVPERVEFSLANGTNEILVIPCQANEDVPDVVEEKVFTKHKKTREEVTAHLRREAIFASYIVGFLLLAVACVVIIFPAIYFALEGIVAILAPNLGLKYSFKLMNWYVSYGYLFNGLAALPVYAEVKGIDAALAVLAGVLVVCGYLYSYWRVGSWAELQLLPKSEMLDNRPKAEESYIYGQGRLVRRPSEIRNDPYLATYNPNVAKDKKKTLKASIQSFFKSLISHMGGSAKKVAEENVEPVVDDVLDSEDEKLSKTTFFLGFVDGPIQYEAIARAIMPVRKLVWWIKRAFRALFKAKDVWGQKVTEEKPSRKGFMRYVYVPEFVNVLLVGTTRSGKTRRVNLPTLVLNMIAGVSMLVMDPKGELSALVKWLAKKLYGEDNVAEINLRNPWGSDHINPLQPVIDAAKASVGGVFLKDKNGVVLGDYTRMEMRANDLTKQLIPEELDTGTAKFFNQGARACIKSGICYICSNQSEAPDDQKTLAQVARLIDEYMRPLASTKRNGNSYVVYKNMMEAKLPHNHPAIRAFAPCAGTKDEYLASFCTTALNFIQDWCDRGIEKMTSSTDINFADLGKEKKIIFLVIPHEKQTYDRIATLFLQQAYQALIEESVLSGTAGKLQQPVTFLCEELGNLPAVPDLRTKLNISLGAGIQWILVFQSIGQIDAVYGKLERESILSGCQYKVMLSSGDKDTAELFSSLVGTYDCLEVDSQKQRGFMSPVPSSTSESKKLTAREVLKPEELTKWSTRVEGSLVTRYAGGGPWAISLPDVSQTPAGEMLRINDMEFITEQYRKSYETSAPEMEETIRWEPCLETINLDGLTEDDYRRIRNEFFKKMRKVGQETPKISSVPPEGKIVLPQCRDFAKEREFPKAALVDYMQAVHKRVKFSEVDTDFDGMVYRVVIDGIDMEIGRGRNIKEAQINACRNTLKSFDKYFVIDEEKRGRHAKRQGVSNVNAANDEEEEYRYVAEGYDTALM